MNNKHTLGRVDDHDLEVCMTPTLSMVIRIKYPKVLSEIQEHQEDLFWKIIFESI